MPFLSGFHYPYNYEMGIFIGDQKKADLSNSLPDPAEWNYQVGDLDTSGARDATGLLHRAYVATKINYEFKWNGLEWKMLQRILALVNTPQFKLTAPDPRTFNTMYSGDYYVGDRTGGAKYFIQQREEIAVYDLKLKFIEY